MDLSSLKSFAKKHSLVYRGGVIINKLRAIVWPVRGKDNKISIKGNVIKLKKSIEGNDNVVEIKGSTLIEPVIQIRGNCNRLVIEEGCYLGKGCSFQLEGNNNSIVIGKKTTMTLRCHFNAQEHNTKILVGEDCMFSNTIIVRTSDSHPIYNVQGERINPAKDVIIGKHVWIAPNSVIMKGAVIGDGCIVGSSSMVNKQIPESSLAVGTPAKVVKENVSWTREDVLK